MYCVAFHCGSENLHELAVVPVFAVLLRGSSACMLRGHA